MSVGFWLSISSAVAAACRIVCFRPRHVPASPSSKSLPSNPPTPPRRAAGSGCKTTHDLAARNHTVRSLIAAAWNLSPKVIFGGPSWVDSERFDILAKAPGDIRPNLDEQMSMVRRLVADRFQLTYHREAREMRLFALTVAKGGPKMKASDMSAAAPPEVRNR